MCPCHQDSISEQNANANANAIVDENANIIDAAVRVDGMFDVFLNRMEEIGNELNRLREVLVVGFYVFIIYNIAVSMMFYKLMKSIFPFPFNNFLFFLIFLYVLHN